MKNGSQGYRKQGREDDEHMKEWTLWCKEFEFERQLKTYFRYSIDTNHSRNQHLDLYYMDLDLHYIFLLQLTFYFKVIISGHRMIYIAFHKNVGQELSYPQFTGEETGA